MDTQVILNVLSMVSGLGTAAFFIIRWVLNRKEIESDYDRAQRWGKQDYFKLLDERAKELAEARVDMEKLIVKIDLLQKTIDELKSKGEADREEISSLRHELRNWKQSEGTRKEITKQEVKDEIINNGH